MGSKFFITGGAGFIGREVVRQLLQKGNEVIAVDNLSFGRLENIEEFKHSPLFRFIQADILNIPVIKDIIEKEKPQIAIHLAALHYIPYCNMHPEETLNVNVNGTYGLFDILTNNNVSMVLFASSGALYPSLENELMEDVVIPQPVDIYGVSKLFGEYLCEYFSRISETTFIAMRFFNTYGPYETNPHLIPEIIKQLRNGNYELQLGNVKTKRDYIYVEDIARAICLLSEKHFEKRFDILNIGTGFEYSAEEIVRIISKVLKKDIKIRIDSMKIRNKDKMHQIASLNKITKAINWRPLFSIENGLKELLKKECLI